MVESGESAFLFSFDFAGVKLLGSRGACVTLLFPLESLCNSPSNWGKVHLLLSSENTRIEEYLNNQVGSIFSLHLAERLRFFRSPFRSEF